MVSRQQVQYLDTSITLGTLAARTAITSGLAIDGSRNQGVMLKQLKGIFRTRGLTADEGPILVGLSLGLSATEVEEALEADPQGFGDVPGTEQGNRRVYPVAITENASSQVTEVAQQMDWWRKIRFPWKEIREGETLAVWAYNLSAAVLTTGGSVRFNGVAVQEWLDD